MQSNDQAQTRGHPVAASAVNGQPIKVFQELDADLAALAEKKRAQEEADAALWWEKWKEDDRIYLPDPLKPPEAIPPILKLHSFTVGSVGNLSMIIADPGSGKSQVCAAIGAKMVNPGINAFGFSVHARKRVLYIDTEQADEDTWRLQNGMLRRAEHSPIVWLPIVLYANFRSVDSIAERQELIFPAMNSGQFDLVIFDGVGDLVHDPNDLREAIAFVMKIAAIANRKKLHILSTIHPNPGDSRKPRGHIGSEMQRKCQSVMVLEKDQMTKIRSLTMNDRFGKNRTDNDELETHFRWNDAAKMFTECGKEEIPETRPGRQQKGREEWMEYIGEAFAHVAEQPFVTLTDRLVTISRKAPSTCQKKIGEMIEWGILAKRDGQYRLLNSDANEYPEETVEINEHPF